MVEALPGAAPAVRRLEFQQWPLNGWSLKFYQFALSSACPSREERTLSLSTRTTVQELHQLPRIYEAVFRDASISRFLPLTSPIQPPGRRLCQQWESLLSCGWMSSRSHWAGISGWLHRDSLRLWSPGSEGHGLLQTGLESPELTDVWHQDFILFAGRITVEW